MTHFKCSKRGVKLYERLHINFFTDKSFQIRIDGIVNCGDWIVSKILCH